MNGFKMNADAIAQRKNGRMFVAPENVEIPDSVGKLS